MTRTNYLEVLAWTQCPLAAQAGYLPPHPRGNLAWARMLADTWPVSSKALSHICPSALQGNKWLQGTQFGVQRITQGPTDAPPSLPGVGHWRKGQRSHAWIGALDIIVSDDEVLRVDFELPYLHKIQGAWEIVLIDASTSLPSKATRAALSFEASFLSECFRILTGEYAYISLVAPGYSHEERLYYPKQSMSNILALYHTTKAIGYLRPGDHCNFSKTDSSRGKSHRKWLCPLREADKCTPFPNK